jgi:hypothetical protein
MESGSYSRIWTAIADFCSDIDTLVIGSQSTVDSRQSTVCRDQEVHPTMRLPLEIAMPCAVLAAVAVGAVVASAQPNVERVEIEPEEIVTEVAVEEEPLVVEPLVVTPPPPPKKPIVKQEELGTSKLDLDITEGATVWLGKKKLGVAPIEKMEIVEGRYLLKIEKGDSTFAEWVDVPPGGTFTYRFTLSADAPAPEELAPDSK